ncbi:MAG: tetratricopeptide repeat protein [Candidatus Babeliales bacterium]|nr:tetratricopeptide repeat protein [Candidatus Babeliales bacterium]
MRFNNIVKFGVATLFIIGIFMTLQTNTNIKLDNFDDAWSLGDPVEIEKKLNELLPQAEILKDKSIYLQMLSQIALTQAMQQKFEDAHKTLDKAEALLAPEYVLAKVRILLERGRVFQQEDLLQQAGKLPEARNYFEQAFELSKKHNFDLHTINVAHMIAIIAQAPHDKIKWNKLAIDIAVHTKDEKAKQWFGSLYNNLGQNYLEAKEYELALPVFEKALEYRKKENYLPNIRVAKWAVGSALRFLGRFDEALATQLELIKEYDEIFKCEKFDMPVEILKVVRGYVYEELAEIYAAKTKVCAKLAYDDLSNYDIFRKTEPTRLERLKQLIPE